VRRDAGRLVAPPSPTEAMGSPPPARGRVLPCRPDWHCSGAGSAGCPESDPAAQNPLGVRRDGRSGLEKFCRYWDVDPRMVPMSGTRFHRNAPSTVAHANETRSVRPGPPHPRLDIRRQLRTASRNRRRPWIHWRLLWRRADSRGRLRPSQLSRPFWTRISVGFYGCPRVRLEQYPPPTFLAQVRAV